VVIRRALESEIDALARLWHDSWRDAHAAVVPEELKRIRTPENFRRRMADMIPKVRVAGPVGSPQGFYMNDKDELSQLFVSADARGKGVAAALIADAERELAGRRIETAWLACAIGNDRAARFYEKSGWRRMGEYTVELPTEEGVIKLNVWRFEKKLAAAESNEQRNETNTHPPVPAGRP
jgi:GNAT superfamily N-acetyltransferase